MNQPFIFKKQILSIIFITLLLVLSFLFKVNTIYTIIEFFYLILLLTITFLPSVKRKFEYPISIHYVLFYLPLIIPIFFININYSLNFNILSIIVGVLIGILLKLISQPFQEKNKLYNSDFLLTQISTSEFLTEFLGSFIAIVGEEVFFRYFLIGLLSIKIGPLSIIINITLFVHSHYVNRWANVMFNKKSYLFHNIIGIVLGTFMYYSNSLIGCIIAHAIFNSHEFVTLIKKYRVRNTSNQFFDDY